MAINTDLLDSRNILMLCYYYPPLTDVGCKRSVALSKYFNKNGWRPVVLSVKNPEKSYCAIGNDTPPPGVHIEYTYSIVNLHWFISNLFAATRRLLRIVGVHLKANVFYNVICIPDHFWGWIPLTVIRGLKLIRKHKIDLIYVSCSPHSSAISGIILKRLTGKPLIIDYRDPFHINSYQISGFRNKLNHRIQEYFLENADLVVVNNEDTRDVYIDEYPLVEDKMFTVHNGFDDINLNTNALEKFDKFTIVYTGDFYFQTPAELLFKSISLLHVNERINKNNFQFLFYGDGLSEIDRLAEKYNIKQFVSTSKRIPYKDILQVLSKSHLQLLRIVKPMISTKLFEGIPMNIPFLATIPSGEVEEIIKKYSPSSYIITDDSPEHVQDAILDAMAKYDNKLIENNLVEEFLRKFSRENLTLKLMTIINKRLS